ncbi:D(1) dopamine receptor-like [Montipora foliosa]|uniref:D(1) dopamine receptor-like n=1 Tax=Montipora foliosa TaxID=591990 RepID=UPI0035F1EA63
MNSTYSHSPESQDKSPSFVFIAFSSTLALFVLAGNALVIIAFGKNTCLQTRTNMFIASLAVSDFLVGGVSMPIWIYLTSVNYPENLSGFFEFFGSFDRFSALASIFHLTAISGERYLAITRPFVHETLSSRVYKWMIMAAWVTAGLLTGFFGLCISLQFKALATVTIFIIGFLIPSVLMLTVYTGIFRTARAVINRTPADHTEESIRNKVREERRVALTVTLVTALFVIAWLPFFVVSMLGQFCSNSLPKGYDQTIMVKMVKCLHYLNSAVNPFIYAFRDKKMRSSFIKLLGVRRN